MSPEAGEATGHAARDPRETFRVLGDKDEKAYGEYSTWGVVPRLSAKQQPIGGVHRWQGDHLY